MDSFEVLTDVKRVESMSESTLRDMFERDLPRGATVYIDGEEYTAESVQVSIDIVFCLPEEEYLYDLSPAATVEGENAIWKVESPHPIVDDDHKNVAIYTDASIEILYE